MAPTPDTLTHLTEDFAAAWLQGELTDSRRLLADLHLAQCETCRQRLSSLDATHRGAPAPSAPPAAPGLTRGTAVGRFVVLEQTGSGGMGLVYGAYDPLLERKVALKLLRLENIPARHLPEARSRLLREARSIARLAHPNVVTVFDAGEFGGDVFVAMEFVEGGTLQDWSREARRDWRAILEKYAGAAAGLAAAHAAGVVHRDFKPQNVLLGTDGRPRVADFGLARATTDRTLEGAPPAPSAGSMTSGSELNTAVGTLMGTPAFMSPEQLQGEVADARSDQFSFCVSLYEALYGTRPFVAPDLQQVLQRIRKGDLAPPVRACGPARLRRVVVRGLSADPADRFGSMDALLEALNRVRRAGARRRNLALAALVALALPAAAVVGARSRAEVCAGSDALLATTWSEGRKQALLDAWAATTGGAAGAGAMAPAAGLLDRYANSWAQARTGACEAARVRQEETLEVLSLRMACFERRRRELEAATLALEGARPEQAARLVDVVTSLPPVNTCDAPEVLARTGVKAPPPGKAAAVEAVRARLATVASLQQLHEMRASSLAQEAVREAEQTAFRPLLAEARLALGKSQTTDRAFSAAEQTLHQAVVEAEAESHDEVRMEAEAELARLLGFRQARFAQAQAHMDRSWAVMERLGRSPQDEANLSNLAGTLLFQQSRYEEAEALLRRALSLEHQLHGEEDPRVGRVLSNLAQTQKQQGNLRSAEALGRSAVEMLLRTAGEGYRSTAIARHSLGTILLRAGNGVEARQRMLENHPDLREDEVTRSNANLHVRLAMADLLAGLPDRAEKTLLRVGAFLDAEKFAADSMERLDWQSVRIHHLASLGKWDEALPLARARAALLRQGELASGLPMVDTLLQLGWLELQAGRVSAAEDAVAQARALAEALPRGPTLRDELASLEGEVDLARGRVEAAVHRLEGALRRQQQTELDGWRLARTQFALVRAHHAAGKPEARDRGMHQLEGYLASPQTHVQRLAQSYRGWRAAEGLR
jgi:tetratricopeptide (TPR) repeat protein/predicted Ser/Thr protein kinase